MKDEVRKIFLVLYDYFSPTIPSYKQNRLNKTDPRGSWLKWRNKCCIMRPSVKTTPDPMWDEQNRFICLVGLYLISIYKTDSVIVFSRVNLYWIKYYILLRTNAVQQNISQKMSCNTRVVNKIFIYIFSFIVY